MDTGFLINGKFYEASGLNDLLQSIVTQTTEKVLLELNEQMVEKVAPDDKLYTVSEIATIVRKSNSTVKRHLRIGLLKGHRVGKPWLVLDEDLQNYKLNKY